MAWFHLLLVLLTAASECRANSPLIVSASLEDDTALPCGDVYKKDLHDGKRVRWKKYSTDAGQNKDILSWPERSQDAKNVKWELDEKRPISLFITNVQQSDEGIYTCEFCQVWECTLTNVSLRVKDCKICPSVEVKPSTPFQLNCPVDIKGQTGPVDVTWVLLKGGQPSPLISERVEVNDTSLLIKSPSANDGAWYRCSYTYGKLRRCFDIKMHITNAQVEDDDETTFHQENRTTEQSGVTLTAALSSVISAAVVIAALAGVYVCWRRNRAAQQTQWLPEGAVRDCIHYYYDPATLKPSNDLPDPNQQINVIYQQLDDDNLHTCGENHNNVTSGQDISYFKGNTSADLMGSPHRE